MAVDYPDFTLVNVTTFTQGLTANWSTDWLPFSAVMASAATLTLLAASLVGIAVYGLHLILEAGFVAGSAGLTLEAGSGVVVDRFTTVFAFDDWMPYSGAQVPALSAIILRNNAAQAVTVRGALYAHDRAGG